MHEARRARGTQRLRTENGLLRSRWHRVPAKRCPHYRRSARLEILWHAARYRLSIGDTAAAFCITRQRHPRGGL